MEYLKTEIKTGIVVLVCFLLLLSLTFGITGTKTLGKTKSIVILFKNIGGMTKDAPVNFAGFEVGAIKDIRLASSEERKEYPEYNIATKIVIDSETPIRDDAIIQIKTTGYLGVKYIDISPRTVSAKIIQRGETLLGYTPQDINDIIDFVGKTVAEWEPKITKIINSIEKLVGENGIITSALEDLKKLANDTDEVVVTNKEDIRKIIINLKVISKNLEEFSNDVKENPWKLLFKPSKKKKNKEEKTRTRARTNFSGK